MFARSESIDAIFHYGMKDKLLAFIDLENTGLSPERHEIIQIGLVLVRQERTSGWLTLTVVEELEMNVTPTHMETADPEALEINGYTPEKWEGSIPLKQALETLTSKCADAVPVGHNIAADVMFLTKAFETMELKDPFDYHRLDTIPMAFLKLHNDPAVSKFSLRALCAHLGIENRNAHTALSDARATFELFARLIDAKIETG